MANYTRKFDRDEALALYEKWGNWAQVARRLGVSYAAMYLAFNEEARKKNEARSKKWQMSGVCPGCGKEGTTKHRHMTTHTYVRADAYCRKCAGILRRTSIRDGELKCGVCKEFKPDSEFPTNRIEVRRRYKHTSCKSCGNAARKAYRAKNKVPCEICGTLVEGKGRANSGVRDGVRVPLDPDRPFLCRSCSRRESGLESATPGAGWKRSA
jgi:ribosomal protein S27E